MVYKQTELGLRRPDSVSPGPLSSYSSLTPRHPFLALAAAANDDEEEDEAGGGAPASILKGKERRALRALAGKCTL